MSVSNPTYSPLLSLLTFFSVWSFQSSFCIGKDTVFCPEIERESLLSFKQSLKDPNNLLSSWDDTPNCCKWKGVTCGNLTSHVHQLRLRNVNPSRTIKAKINPSLLNLKYLRYLDLSGNEFSGEKIPSFVGSLAKLEYLNLSGTGFHGQVPHRLGNLSNLRTLDLDGVQYFKQLLVIDSLEWLSGFSQLEYLNMNGANLSKASNWAQVITSLPFLVELHLESCSLDFRASMDNVINVTAASLAHLYLHNSNYLQPPIIVPRWIFQFTNLLSLDLSENGFVGTIPTISNATKLQDIDLSYNHFNSSIPDWFYLCKDLEFLALSWNKLSGKIPKKFSNLCKLRELYLSNNYFQGDISDSFGDMSECFLETLELLVLGHNNLSGHLTNQFGEFKSLEYLDLGRNSFSGVIPINLGKLSSLEGLYLYDNNFTGNLPESLGQLFNLQEFYIDDNMVEGVVTETHFSNLTNLETLSASRNHLTLKVSPNWNPPFQVSTLRMASWNLGAGSKIPSWIKKQKNIWELDLSYTGISGKIPSWIWKIPMLALTHNHLRGKIPYLLGLEDQHIYLDSNQLYGSIPPIGDTIVDLDLSNNSFSGSISRLCDNTYETHGLSILHLGGNQLSGELPADCWIKWPLLRYLNLANNNLSGSIPNSIGYLANLQSLNLHSNNLSGKIPFSMHNCTTLVMMNVADNNLDGGIPTSLGTSLVKLAFLILHSNKLSGKIPLEICHLNSLQILDFSSNSFWGEIPRCIFNFTAMVTKRSLVPLAYYYTSNQPLVESASVVTKGLSLLYESTLLGYQH